MPYSGPNAKSAKANYDKKYRKTPEYKDARVWQRIKDRYGVSKEEWQAKFIDQQGKCAICDKHQSEFEKRFDTDHDHNTGEFRGLLCMPCNTRLGIIENADFVSKAMTYLAKLKLKGSL